MFLIEGIGSGARGSLSRGGRFIRVGDSRITVFCQNFDAPAEIIRRDPVTGIEEDEEGRLRALETCVSCCLAVFPSAVQVFDTSLGAVQRDFFGGILRRVIDNKDLGGFEYLSMEAFDSLQEEGAVIVGYDDDGDVWVLLG